MKKKERKKEKWKMVSESDWWGESEGRGWKGRGGGRTPLSVVFCSSNQWLNHHKKIVKKTEGWESPPHPCICKRKKRMHFFVRFHFHHQWGSMAKFPTPAGVYLGEFLPLVRFSH